MILLLESILKLLDFPGNNLGKLTWIVALGLLCLMSETSVSSGATVSLHIRSSSKAVRVLYSCKMTTSHALLAILLIVIYQKFVQNIIDNGIMCYCSLYNMAEKSSVYLLPNLYDFPMSIPLQYANHTQSV